MSRRASLDYKRTAPISIRETRREQKDRLTGVERAVIAAVREYVFKTHKACQICHGARRGECAGLDDQMHEDPPRSKTRGRPAWERFNILVCGRICAACHLDITEHRIRVVFVDPNLGFLGPVYGEPYGQRSSRRKVE